MLTSSRNSPGVYINEPDGFQHSVMPVATAVPAFIGYTVQAEYQGKSCLNQAQKISSFADFQARYMLPDPPAPADPATQYNPQYYLVAQTTPATRGAAITFNGTNYAIVPDPNTLYYLYNSVRLFYLNGGGEAYIVSVGTYGSASGHPGEVGAQTVNPNVQLADLQRGLALLQNEPEPTLYVCPDAVLLSPEDNSTLMQNMLQQASQKQSAICLFDIIGGEAPDPVMYVNDIETFRDRVGVNGLDYGAAYFLFNMWKQGALQGATPGDAFQVSCGLGETMTGEDILNDFMNVTVKVAVIRPAEFIAISLQQKMAVSG